MQKVWLDKARFTCDYTDYLLKYTLEFAKFEILKVLGEDIKDGGENENQR